MLKNILLKNYRSHEDTLIELDPHVNVIVGRGQAGKTNLMRAFETLRLNRPVGFKYHSWFAGEQDGTTIQVETGEGVVVTFTKDKAGARYVVDGHEYRKVGTKVPDQVTAALNMTELNMQWQLDSHYLIGGSAAQIGKAINAVIDFEELDKWIADINSRKAKLNTERAVVAKQIKEDEKELAGLAGVKKAGDLLAGAELVEREIRGKYIKLEGLTKLLEQGRAAKATLDRCDGMLGAGEFVQRADDAQAEIDYIALSLTELEEAVTLWDSMVRLERRKYMVKQKYIGELKQAGMCPTCFGPADEETLNRIKEGL